MIMICSEIVTTGLFSEGKKDNCTIDPEYVCDKCKADLCDKHAVLNPCSEHPILCLKCYRRGEACYHKR